jgi:peptidoglycan/xylan/chitin deacetylase (PgdA/CDA1 family)
VTLILCYHAVSTTWPASLAIHPEALEGQLQTLLDRGYEGATFSEAVLGEAADERPRLVVTFDDAYRSTLNEGLPVLSRLGLPGTVFAPTAYVGSAEPMVWPGIGHWAEGPHRDELLCLDEQGLGRLVAEGWEVGSHTHTHPRLPDLGSAQLHEELLESRTRIEQLTGAPCRSLAYPFGAFNDSVARAAAEAGYDAACTLLARNPAGDPLLSPRVGIYREDAPWRFRVKTARPVRLLDVSRVRHPLRTRSSRR